MATCTLTARELAEQMIIPRASALHEGYGDYVRALEYGVAGRLTLEADGRPHVVRSQLASATRSEGIDLQIHSRGNVNTFWRKI
jgi:hypothetical protein